MLLLQECSRFLGFACLTESPQGLKSGGSHRWRLPCTSTKPYITEHYVPASQYHLGQFWFAWMAPTFIRTPEEEESTYAEKESAILRNPPLPRAESSFKDLLACHVGAPSDRVADSGIHENT